VTQVPTETPRVTGFLPARVLVVDDQAENLELLTEMLETEGYEVTTARDGLEAVSRALSSPPDLILMDVTMPGLNGIEACRRLKNEERTRLVPIVLVTGLQAREDRLSGVAAGCDDFLTKPVDSELLLARVRNMVRTKSLLADLEQAENVLVSMANVLDAKDPYTRGHSERVARYAEALGSASGLPREDCVNLRRAGLLHDIGKIGIPLVYLNKPAKLTTEEYEVVKLHPAIGYDICQPLRTMAPLLLLIRGHHERLDGRGYPDGLKGERIPTTLRCLTVADVYDALTSDRPYRKAMPAPSALKVMREEASAGMWDAAVIERLATVIERLVP
jgi:putative two-component system response regulator